MRHKHRFRMGAHMDGCHSTTTIYVCDCGVNRVVTEERSVEIDPYSAIWMLDQDCERCKQLLDGAQPHNTSQLVR